MFIQALRYFVCQLFGRRALTSTAMMIQQHHSIIIPPRHRAEENVRLPKTTRVTMGVNKDIPGDWAHPKRLRPIK